MKKKKRDDIMRKLYIRLDIHEAHITGTAMNEQGTIGVVKSSGDEELQSSLLSFFQGWCDKGQWIVTRVTHVRQSPDNFTTPNNRRLYIVRTYEKGEVK